MGTFRRQYEPTSEFPPALKAKLDALGHVANFSDQRAAIGEVLDLDKMTRKEAEFRDQAIFLGEYVEHHARPHRVTRVLHRIVHPLDHHK